MVIFADNIKNTDHLEKTFAHETAGHKGLQALLGKEYTSIIDEIYSAVNQKHGAELQKLAATYGQDLNTVEGQRYIIEEYLADQADLQKLSGFKAFVQKIKLALRKVGFRAKWTDDEITTLMRRSLENVRKQRSPQTGNNNGVRFMTDEVSQGRAVRFLEENGKIIPIAEGFDFDKTADMQQAMQDYIFLLDGEHFTIKEDNTKVYFNEDSATEYARSKDTSRLRNHKSKLFKAKAKAVAAVGSIIENAAGGRDEAVKAGHSKEGKKGKYRRYDVEFGLPSGTSEVKVYTGELVVWNPEKGKSTFYDITNINFSRKVRDTANAIDTTGSRLKDGTNPHQLPANDDTLSQNPENASGNQENLRFSIAPVIESNKQWRDPDSDPRMIELEQQKAEALKDPLNALADNGQRFADIIGDEEWAEMSEEERIEHITGSYDDTMSELYQEIEEEQQFSREDAESLISQAYDATVQYAEQLGYTVTANDVSRKSLSTYITVNNGSEDFKIRISDHWNINRSGVEHFGNNDVDVIVQNDKIDLSDVWQFLEQNAPDNGVRFSISPVDGDGFVSTADKENMITVLMGVPKKELDQMNSASAMAYLTEKKFNVPDENVALSALNTAKARRKEQMKRLADKRRATRKNFSRSGKKIVEKSKNQPQIYLQDCLTFELIKRDLTRSRKATVREHRRRYAEKRRATRKNFSRSGKKIVEKSKNQPQIYLQD